MYDNGLSIGRCAKVSATPAVDAARTIAARMSTAAAATATAGASAIRTPATPMSSGAASPKATRPATSASVAATAVTAAGLSRGLRTPRSGAMPIPAAAMEVRMAPTPTQAARIGSPAAQRGFEDGYNDGRNDARDNDRYEPTRKKKYRDGRRWLQQPLRVEGPVQERLSPGIPAGVRPRLSRVCVTVEQSFRGSEPMDMTGAGDRQMSGARDRWRHPTFASVATG